MTQEDKTLSLWNSHSKKTTTSTVCPVTHHYKTHHSSRNTPQHTTQSTHTGRPLNAQTHTHTHITHYSSVKDTHHHHTAFNPLSDTHMCARAHTHTHATRLCVFMPFALNVMKHSQHSRTYTSSHVWRQVTVYNVSHEDYGFIRQCSRTLAIETCTHSSLYLPD